MSYEQRLSELRPLEYQVELVEKILDLDNDTLARASGVLDNHRCLVIADDGVGKHYGQAINAYYDAFDADYRVIVMATSEGQKSLDTAVRVLVHLDEFGLLRRSERVVAIGGGVLTDLVGFAASIYRRGVTYLRVPTTLIGLVDAGVGVKTGVRLGRGKNRVGSYYAPTHVLLDPNFLETLPDRHIRNGIAEIVKMGIIKDPTILELIDRHGPQLVARRFQGGDVAMNVLERAIDAILAELRPNLWEAQLERSLDFGHTFSPRLEMYAKPEILHGEAVAVDMALSLMIAKNRGLILESECDWILNLMSAVGLPIEHELFDVDFLVAGLQESQKHRDGLQRFPLPKGLGDCLFVNDIDRDEISDALAELRRLRPPRDESA